MIVSSLDYGCFEGSPLFYLLKIFLLLIVLFIFVHMKIRLFAYLLLGKSVLFVCLFVCLFEA